MDYEKKDFRKLYEDLVKSDWFKKAYHNKSLGECPFDIPELNESEDKRITRAINNMLPFIPDDAYANNGVTKEQVLAWLEKQKEQKVDIDKLRRDLYQSGYNDGYQHGQEDAQKEQKPNIELIGHGDSAHLIRKYKKHLWSKWQIEMDGATPKIYPVDQKHCVHDYEFVEIVYTVSFPAGVPMRLMRCTKCGHERVTRL